MIFLSNFSIISFQVLAFFLFFLKKNASFSSLGNVCVKNEGAKVSKEDKRKT